MASERTVLDALEKCWSRAGALAAQHLDAPTATDWDRRELLLHQLLDARRLLVALASPAETGPDTDHVTYWRSFPPGRPGARSHATYVRRAAAAYADPHDLLEEWDETTAAALHAARLADPSEVVRTQGHHLSVSDLLRTVLVEATLHLLDQDPHRPHAPEAAVALTVETLSGLLGDRWPADDDLGWVLRTTGRAPLDATHRTALGARVDRLPLLA